MISLVVVSLSVVAVLGLVVVEAILVLVCSGIAFGSGSVLRVFWQYWYQW